MSELKPSSANRSDRERFGDILALQRAAFLRDGPPSLTKRRSDLKKLKAAMLARRSAIEEAIDTDFGIAVVRWPDNGLLAARRSGASRC
jgi:hypothetical protein